MPEGLRSYWANIKTSIKTLKKGLEVTEKHIKQARNQRTAIGPANTNYFDQQNGLFTVQYPKEQIPVPDNGRYKLHNEIEDCIVCDKCAKVCPVDCIDIEPVRATEEFGKTSDGTSKRIYAAKFDIDMAKCCFCGLCTTVCPTECLTMTNEYDFSAFDFAEHNVPFANMTPLEILEKKKEFEEFTRKKAEQKAQAGTVTGSSNKPVMKPAIKPGATKPVVKPKIAGAQPNKPKVVIKPKVQVNRPEEASEKPKIRPIIKPKVQPGKEENPDSQEESKAKLKPKVPMHPKIPPRKKDNPEDES